MEKINYPRPQFRRESLILLDGLWDFKEDAGNEGERLCWGAGFDASEKILVPFSPETAASGIGRESVAMCVWYQRGLQISREQLEKRFILNFDGVDQLSKLWVNGCFIGRHEGAYSRFSFDISSALHEGENLIVLKAEDSFCLEQPRGKQRWLNHSYSCWYTPTTGIWKSVWGELVSETHLRSVKLTPILSDYSLKLEYCVCGRADDLWLDIDISFGGEPRKRLSVGVDAPCGCVGIDMVSGCEENQIRLWSLHSPELYDLKLTLRSGSAVLDEVESYFGFRDFRSEGSRLCLNGMPVYEKLVLYQGYWQQSGLTAPSEEAIIRDLEMIRELGCNGLRIHQKVESELLLYHADRLGLLVWCEMPSPHNFNDGMKQRFTREWMNVLRQNYNHPSVVTWLIFNESWGVRGIRREKDMQAFANGLYYLTKGFDPMRPVIANDGWESVLTDIVGLHNYEQEGERLFEAYASLERTMQNEGGALVQYPAFADGCKYEGQPVVISEFGGCGFKRDMQGESWGYCEADGEEDFYGRLRALTAAIRRLDYVSGFCYTQFSDVEQERNGLVTMDRQYKVDPAIIRSIIL